MISSRKISYSLIYLLPLAIPSGPFLPDLIISILSILFIYEYFTNKIEFKLNNKFLLFLLSINIYLIFTSLMSDNISLSLQSTLFYFRFSLFTIFFVILLNSNSSLIKNFFYINFFLYTFIILDALFQYYFNYNFLGFEKESRLSGVFKDELKLGSYIIKYYFVFIVSMFLVIKNKKISNLILVISSISVLYLTFLTEERTAFYLGLFSILFIFLMSNLNNLIKAATFVAIFSSIFLLSISNISIYDRMFKYTKNQIYNNDTFYIFSPHHQSHISVSIELFKRNYIFGIGPKMFREKCKEKDYKLLLDLEKDPCSTHTHNFAVQILSETGILGFFIYLFVLLYSFYKLAKLIQKRLKSKFTNLEFNFLITLTAIITFLIPIAPSGNFFNNWLSIFLFLYIVFLINNNKNILFVENISNK